MQLMQLCTSITVLGMMTLVQCYYFTAGQLVSKLNGKLTENVFILHCRASKMVDSGSLVECYGDACAVIIWGVWQYARLSSFHIVLPYLVLITLCWVFLFVANGPTL